MYESKDKLVSHPAHYQSETGLEVIDVIEAFTFDLKGTLNLQLLAVERPVKRLHSPAHHIRNKVFRPDHILRFLCANLTLFAELSTRHTENLRSGAAVSGFGITI